MAMAKTVLDPHSESLLEQYRSLLPVFGRLAEEIPQRLRSFLADSGIVVAAIEQRIKTETSLEGKLRQKGGK